MMRVMKLFLAVWLGTVLGSAAWAAPLDGTKWKITVTPDAESLDNGAKEFAEELTFAEDNMSTTNCAGRGFKTSMYLVTEDDEVLKWKTVQHSETAGVGNWAGTVEDAKMSGKLIWSQRNGTRYVYTFAGERVGPAPVRKNDRTD